MRHCKITSNPRLMQTVTAASNRDLSHLGKQTVVDRLGLSSPVVFLEWKPVQLIIRCQRNYNNSHDKHMLLEMENNFNSRDAAPTPERLNVAI